MAQVLAALPAVSQSILAACFCSVVVVSAIAFFLFRNRCGRRMKVWEGAGQVSGDKGRSCREDSSATSEVTGGGCIIAVCLQGGGQAGGSGMQFGVSHHVQGKNAILLL